jgi:hypothetical protein
LPTERDFLSLETLQPANDAISKPQLEQLSSGVWLSRVGL